MAAGISRRRAGVLPALVLLSLSLLGGCSSSEQIGTDDGGPDPLSRTGWVKTDDGPTLALPSGEPLSNQAWNPDTRWRLVNFWASTCGPCRQEIPELTSLDDRDDLQVIGVSRDQFARYAREFEDEVGATFPSWLDPDGEYAAQLRRLTPVDFLPLSALLDEGRVVALHLGPLKDLAGLEALVDSPR